MTATPEAAPASRQNALSSRITSVLSASYSDVEIRDALAMLDQQSFKNTSESRRHLRIDAQEEVIRRNADILRDFKGVADELHRVETSLSRLTATCAAMRVQIQSANQTTAPVLEEAGILFSQKKEVETKQHVLHAFQKHFLMTLDEMSSLTSSSEPVDTEFFTALQKLKQVHADSQLLLSSSNDRLGLSILDTSSKTLNSAFQKLFRWTQREFKTLDLENPRIGAAIRKALRVLAERPQLFSNSLDNFASAREETLSDSFHAALTGQGDAIVGKPIEFQAHDPIRYISDMLAWAHSATVSEREALEVLFIGEGEELAKGIKEGIDNDPWSRKGDNEVAEVFDGRKALNELVSRNIAGVSRQLRQRTEQVIQSQEEAVVAYRIANLIAFYKSTFQKLLGEDADILKTLTVIESAAQHQFRENMADQVALMKPELEVAPTDLSPPEFLIEALETLKLLLKSHDTSLAAASGDSDSGIEAVFTAALDPFLDGCRIIWSNLPPPNQSILALNCLLDVRATLTPYPFTSVRLDSLDPLLRQHATTLTEHQHTSLLTSSGLTPLVAACSGLPSSPSSPSAIDLQSLPPLLRNDTAALGTIARKLDEFLPSALMDAMDGLAGLRSARLAREVTEEAAEQFCDEFEMIEGTILAVDEAAAAAIEKDGDEDEDDEEKLEAGDRKRLRDVFPRTTEEIRVLLS
jgi:PAS domain-containing protein